jgi:hypothetical protein
MRFRGFLVDEPWTLPRALDGKRWGTRRRSAWRESGRYSQHHWSSILTAVFVDVIGFSR